MILNVADSPVHRLGLDLYMGGCQKKKLFIINGVGDGPFWTVSICRNSFSVHFHEENAHIVPKLFRLRSKFLYIQLRPCIIYNLCTIVYSLDASGRHRKKNAR